jgi:hypothetical protein
MLAVGHPLCRIKLIILVELNLKRWSALILDSTDAYEDSRFFFSRKKN